MTNVDIKDMLLYDGNPELYEKFQRIKQSKKKAHLQAISNAKDFRMLISRLEAENNPKNHLKISEYKELFEQMKKHLNITDDDIK